MTIEVNDVCVEKVERYLIKQVRERGSRQFSVRVGDIAFGSDVALATAHKVLKLLENKGIIKIIRGDTRRVPNQYQYLADIDFEETKFNQAAEVRKLKSQVDELIDQITKLRSENNRLRQQFYGR